MPWISVQLPAEPPSVAEVAAAVAIRAAEALQLTSADVLVQVHVAAASSGAGAVVVATGRRRDPDSEARLEDALRAAVAKVVGVPGDFVAVVRAGT